MHIVSYTINLMMNILVIIASHVKNVMKKVVLVVHQMQLMNIGNILMMELILMNVILLLLIFLIFIQLKILMKEIVLLLIMYLLLFILDLL